MDTRSKSDSAGAGPSGPTRRDLMGAAAAIAMTPTVVAAADAKEAPTKSEKAFWPNGARLAIAVTLAVETGADAPATLKTPAGAAVPDLFAQSAAEYATREAIPRVLDMLDRRKIKATALMCAASADKFPDMAKQVAERGHECAAHGKTHANQFSMSRDEERAFIQGAVDLLKKTTGQTPVGWNCRAQARSTNTLSLLQELGFLYHVDDVSRDEPFFARVDGKPFVVVPYTQHLTDFSFFNRGNGSSDAFEKELRLEFDALYAEAATKRRMMAVTIHDSIARPARVRAIENFLAYAQGHKGVWATRCDEIAKWAKASPITITDPTAV